MIFRKRRSPALRVRAPAKINWTLEVLGKRPDGYHDVRTVLQAIALSDWVGLARKRGRLRELGRGAFDVPEDFDRLLGVAAILLMPVGEQLPNRGDITFRVEKHIPIAAGLGGGSSDAASALRGLRFLQELDLSDNELADVAGELGSDVAFFLHGGTALASGRGELIEPLPDLSPERLVIAWPDRSPRQDKTARMYAALRPEHYTDGARTERVAARIRSGEPVRDADIYSVFEAVLPEVDSEGAELFERAARLGFGRPHLCGSGPAFFFLLDRQQEAAPLVNALEGLGLRGVETETLSASQSLAIEELS